MKLLQHDSKQKYEVVNSRRTESLDLKAHSYFALRTHTRCSSYYNWGCIHRLMCTTNHDATLDSSKSKTNTFSVVWASQEQGWKKLYMPSTYETSSCFIFLAANRQTVGTRLQRLCPDCNGLRWWQSLHNVWNGLKLILVLDTRSGPRHSW